MSRIGKKPIPLPSAVKVTIAGRQVVVENGPQRLEWTHRPEVKVTLDTDANAIVVDRVSESRSAKAQHGLARSLIANMVEGVTKGFEKELEIMGVGWNGTLERNKLVLKVGYADAREMEVLPGLTVEVNGNRIKISGADKQAVGQFAADVRRQRPPEPYNGKGIKYIDEQIVRKQGKAFAAGAA